MSSDPKFDRRYKKIWAEIEALPAEQQQQLRGEALEHLLRRRRVKVDGKVTSLRNLQRRVDAQRRAFESGAYDETVRSLPRWQVQDLTPGWQIRQGAYKQQLREREEADLELDRFGHGVVFSPRPVSLLNKLLGGRRDFAWGMYARPGDAEGILKSKWAGQDPQAAAASGELYFDILRYCHQMELTLMVLTSRPLPLADTRAAMAERLESSMRRLSGGEPLEGKAKADLKDFISLFDDERVAPAGWVDFKSGCIKQGTHFVLSTTPAGELAMEAITPGRLKDKRTSQLGVARSQLLTGAVFDMFLGPQPLDEAGKKDVGHGMLWVANGFRFRPWEAREGQFVAQEGPDGTLTFPPPEEEAVETMAVPLRPSVFQLLEEQTKPLRRMLVGSVRRAQRQPSAAAAAATQG